LQTSYARVFAIALPAALGGAALAPRIIETFFGAEYGDAALALVVLLASIPIAVLGNAATAALISRGGGGTIFRITAFAAVIATVLGLALIPGLGILGAALATVATEAAHAFWSLRAARELGFAAMEPRRFLVPSLAGALMVGVVLAVAARPLWVAVPVGVLVYASALAACGALRLRPDGMPSLRV
jgi:O-antigen/teichoic acid export membrane protein